MGDPRGYYRLLGVPRSASAEEIRLAFRARAMASHPDRQGASGGDDEVFRLVREAYEVLRDPLKRMAYDADGLDAEHAQAAARAAGGNGQERRERVAREQRPAAARGTVREAAIERWLGRAVPLATGALALALVVAMASLWSARRQLEEREILLADLYGRLNRTAAVEAELRAQLRSATFLDLERAMRRGPRLTGDVGRYAYAETIDFPAGRVGLGAAQEDRLTLAIVELAQRIEIIPGDVDWLIVLETQAAAAADGDGVAVEAWEPALLRLASVLDHLLAQGLPSERMAIRFNAGFAAYPAPGAEPDGPAEMRDAVAVRLVCCVD
jgi:curved DNA-binding protein